MNYVDQNIFYLKVTNYVGAEIYIFCELKSYVGAAGEILYDFILFLRYFSRKLPAAWKLNNYPGGRLPRYIYIYIY